MWKALFLATGICLSVLGAECLVVERCYLKPKQARQADAAVAPSLMGPAAGTAQAGREVVPPEWAPWSLMAAGAVVILYSITLPKRIAG